MRDESYRTAFDQANAELSNIVREFERLRARKDQIATLVEALKPFAEMHDGARTTVAEKVAEPVKFAPEPEAYSFTHTAATSVESSRKALEQPVAQMQTVAEPVEQTVSYVPEPSSDPFQRRIDDALWGWRQRPASILSTT